MAKPLVIKWVLDTRPLWPDATETKHLPTVAHRALALVTSDERTSILKYYFIKDAKLALASALLKRHVISKYCRVPWSAAQWTRDARTKPVFRLPSPGGAWSEPLLFNVTHQAGIVVLLAVHDPPAGGGLSIGVDVVCPTERRDRDHNLIAEEGWSGFVDMHELVFSPEETARLKTLPFAGDHDRRLRYFYALWCLREGYVKMTGEALLAEWLKDLDLRYFAPPGEEAPEGRELEMWFEGSKVEDVHMNMEWYLGDYMICTAVRGNSNGEVDMDGSFELLNMDEVLDEAEQANR